MSLARAKTKLSCEPLAAESVTVHCAQEESMTSVVALCELDDISELNRPSPGRDWELKTSSTTGPEHWGNCTSGYADGRGKVSSSPVQAIVGSAKYLGILAFAAFLLVAAVAFTQSGYDWCYYMLRHVIGQPSDDQGIGAGLLTLYVIPPLGAGLIAGALQSMFGGKWRWTLGFTALFGVFFCLDFALGTQGTMEGWIRAALSMLGAGTVVLATSIPAKWLASELKLRMNTALPLLATTFLAALPCLLLTDANMEWWQELATYVAVMFAAGVAAPMITRSRSKETDFASVFMAILPVTVFNLANLGFTLFSMVARNFGWLDVGWHATLSALIIMLVSFAAAFSGGKVGGGLSRLVRPT